VPRIEYAALDRSSSPLATVVTPFFNEGRDFLAAERTVLGQSLQQLEWLIVNDGSSDPESMALLDEFRNRDPRIRVIDHAGHRGPGAARDTGSDAATAPYVVQLDPDDVLEATALEKWCWYLESHPEKGATDPRVARKARGAVGHGAPADDVPNRLPCQNLLRKDRRRLLLLTPWMSLGGADRFNLDVLDELTRQDWEVTIATTLAGDHSWLPRYAVHTPDVFCLHDFLAPRDSPRFLRYLITSRQIDTVMITHSELGYALLPYLRAHAPRVTYVDYCHIVEEGWKGGGYPRMSVDANEWLDLTIVSSRHLAEWMQSRGSDPQRIRVQYTNVDTNAWRPDRASRAATRRELGVEEAVGVILFAGRLHAQKRPRLMAETLNQLNERHVPFLALLAGDGPERRWLESYIATRRLDERVRLLGEVSPERLQALMQAADVFFLPSAWEGIALTLFEALASGVPVVAARVGGQDELVTPECGVLVAPGSAEGESRRYARVLEQLLTSPGRRQELGAAGRARVVRRFRRADMGAGMGALLAEADKLRQCEPRDLVPISLGMSRAEQAVCSAASGQSSADLWAAPGPDGIRLRAYLLLSRAASPLYRVAGRRGWTWFFVLGERVKRALFQSGREDHA
jgi:glycosyltransferase involved in cell wall biosynthesis